MVMQRPECRSVNTMTILICKKSPAEDIAHEGVGCGRTRKLCNSNDDFPSTTSGSDTGERCFNKEYAAPRSTAVESD